MKPRSLKVCKTSSSHQAKVPRRQSCRQRNIQRSSEPLPQDSVEVSIPHPLPLKRSYTSHPQDFQDSTEIASELPTKRARLTKKNLEAFENMRGRGRGAIGKSSGRNSAGKSSAGKSGRNSAGRSHAGAITDSDSSSSMPSLSTTKSGFNSLALRNGILNEKYSKPPANLGDRQSRLDRERDTASPTESEYEYFASCVRGAGNEATILNEVSTLLKRHKKPGYQAQLNTPFNNFPKDVGFNNGLSAAQPDIIEGLNASEFDRFPVFEQLSGAATPYGDGSDGPSTALPHIAGELKGPGGTLRVAHNQGAYDGACMVYGRNEARSFLQSPDPPDHAFVSTFTSDGRTLDTFAHYASESQGQVKYHQYLTSSTPLISTFGDFKKGRQRLRNLQDDAREMSEKLRDELNEKWSENPTTNNISRQISADLMLTPQDMDEKSSENPATKESFLQTSAEAEPLKITPSQGDCTGVPDGNGDWDADSQFLITNWNQVNVSQHGTVLDLDGYTDHL